MLGVQCCDWQTLARCAGTRSDGRPIPRPSCLLAPCKAVCVRTVSGRSDLNTLGPSAQYARPFRYPGPFSAIC